MAAKTLIAIVGPTAVGKTAAAIFLAQHYNTVILSADSRQFYRELNIGTAKPDAHELAQAKHYFIDSHSIAQEYSAGDFERDALDIVAQLFKQHDIIILVGGSGLFVRALCEGLDHFPKADEATRAHLNQAYQQHGLEPLQQRLLQVDPDYYLTADISNPQRVIRALEIFEETGQPFSSFHLKKTDQRPFQVLTIGLHMDRAALYERINLRVEMMLANGLLQEVKSVLPYRDKAALQTVGYTELFDFLDGHCTYDEAVDKIKQNSRRYAKRQITWFKKYGNTKWFEPAQRTDILTYIEHQMNEASSLNTK